MDVLRNIEGTNGNVNIDYIRYKVDSLCAILTRFSNNLEDSLLSHIMEAQSILANLLLLCTERFFTFVLPKSFRIRKFKISATLADKYSLHNVQVSFIIP